MLDILNGIDKDSYYLVRSKCDNLIELIFLDSPYFNLNDIRFCFTDHTFFDIVACPSYCIRFPSIGLLIDDCGKLFNLNYKINSLGTYLYDNPYDCIAGDCLIGTFDRPLISDEPDLFCFDYDQLKYFLKQLPPYYLSLFKF